MGIYAIQEQKTARVDEDTQTADVQALETKVREEDQEKVTVKNTDTNNLKPPWKPGQSGNPNGRPPKEHTLTDMLREAASLPHDDTGKARKHVLTELMWERALNGDIDVMKYLYDRIDGKPSQTINQFVGDMPDVIGYYSQSAADEDSDTD